HIQGGSMARTPLLTALQGLYRNIEEAEDCKTPYHSRRDFLKLSGVAAATAILGTNSGYASAKPSRIYIIGGRIAGLHAALTLQDAGLTSIVYEASNRIGG